jgi:hypothetical protein
LRLYARRDNYKEYENPVLHFSKVNSIGTNNGKNEKYFPRTISSF